MKAIKPCKPCRVSRNARFARFQRAHLGRVRAQMSGPQRATQCPPHLLYLVMSLPALFDSYDLLAARCYPTGGECMKPADTPLSDENAGRLIEGKLGHQIMIFAALKPVLTAATTILNAYISEVRCCSALYGLMGCWICGYTWADDDGGEWWRDQLVVPRVPGWLRSLPPAGPSPLVKAAEGSAIGGGR